MSIRSVLLLTAVVSVSGIVYSQIPAGTDGQRGGQVLVDVVQVPLLVSVTDNKGKLITNLRKEDFRIFEDDKPQKIEAFHSDKDLPLSIALLIDSSGSVIDKLKFEQEAATEFFFNTIKRRKDRGAVVYFDANAYTLVDFTDQAEVLADGVRRIRAGGGTAVYDAVYHSTRKMLALENGERRKLIILISDGDDTASRYSLPEALEMAQRHDVTIYAISTNRTSDTKRSEQVRGDDVIQKLVDETGGKAYFPLKLDDLASDFQKIGDELRSQYVVYYNPTNGKLDGTYRKVSVEMSDKKYKARTRRGYFATKSD